MNRVARSCMFSLPRVPQLDLERSHDLTQFPWSWKMWQNMETLKSYKHSFLIMKLFINARIIYLRKFFIEVRDNKYCIKAACIIRTMLILNKFPLQMTVNWTQVRSARRSSYFNGYHRPLEFKTIWFAWIKSRITETHTTLQAIITPKLCKIVPKSVRYKALLSFPYHSNPS